jgi:phospholipid/cholesterol/gamma-HCH transport system permease protein
MNALLERIGRVFLRFFEQTGLWFTMLWRTIVWGTRRPFEVGEWFKQMVRVGVDSVPVVFLTSMFTGMVLALQTYTGFQRVHAENFVGSVVALAMLRELSPVLVGLMVTGRIGSSMAAEIGTMRVTEQIDALETLSYDPVAFLILPRLLAAIVMLPCLVVLADATGLFSGYLVSVHVTGVTPQDFIAGVRLGFAPFQVVYSLLKATLFGAAIAFVCSYEGFITEAGAEGVGKSTAKAVVITSVTILILDTLTAALLAPYLQT